MNRVMIACFLLAAAPATHAAEPTATPSESREIAVPKPKLTTFQVMTTEYEAIRASLIKDTHKGVAAHATSIRDAAKGLHAEFDATQAGVPKDKAVDCQKLLPEIEKAAGELATAKALAGAREAFFALSKPLIRYRALTTGVRPIVVYCSMIERPWLQPPGEIGNPYYGQEMLRCGQIVAKD